MNAIKGVLIIIFGAGCLSLAGSLNDGAWYLKGFTPLLSVVFFLLLLIGFNQIMKD